MIITRTRRTLLLVCSLLLASLFAQAQHTVSGILLDKGDNSSLIGVTVTLTSMADTTKKVGTATDIDGNFSFRNVAPGQYRLRAMYISYVSLSQAVTVNQADVSLGNLYMQVAPRQLSDVIVKDKQIRAEQKGDTTEYRADAFKTNPDASTQDLITKMPGVTVENGTVKAQGEEVKKVLIDGQEFFGDDATLALRNLPAEIVDRIQVYDRMSDQARFTGVDDGNSQKTLNIVTKAGKNNGQFGKIYAGYGTDNRYQAGGNINLFKGKRRISIIGLSNNINQQNFSSQDLLGVTSSSGGGGNRGGGNFGGPRGGGSSGGPRGGGGSTDNFMVGQQNGISTTHSIGLNYRDMWGKKLTVSGSYFFNHTDNSNSTVRDREYFLPGQQSQLYKELNDASSQNNNHRANFRFEYAIDTNNTIIFTPTISLQYNQSSSTTTGLNSLSDGNALSSTLNRNNSDNSGYSSNNNLLYQHRFAKRGRTISLNTGFSLNDKEGTNNLYAANEFFAGNDSSTFLNQQSNTNTNGNTLSANVSYTEPIGKKSILMFSYAPSRNLNISDKQTRDYDSTLSRYEDLDTLLSSKYENTIVTQRAGINFRNSGAKHMFMAGVNYQNTQLNGDQQFPYAADVHKTFSNFLPMAMFNYKFTKTSNLRLFYRSSTNLPSVTQLQPVVNNTNPLLLTGGNPNLAQEFSNSIRMNYTRTNTEKARTFVAALGGEYITDYIGNSTLIATQDTLIQEGVTLKGGSQFTAPVNLDYSWNMRSFFTYGLPIDLIKCNLNFVGGYTYSLSPSMINGRINRTNTQQLNGGLVLGSNISENLDFTVSYNAYYNTVTNTVQTQADNNYFYQLASVRFNWLTWKKFVVNSDVNYTFYNGLSSSTFNQSYLLWNAAVAYKFLKNNAAEIRLSAFDLLRQNNSISRTVTETYVEDTRTKVLSQYWMLTLTYNLRNFSGTTAPAPNPSGTPTPGPGGPGHGPGFGH